MLAVPFIVAYKGPQIVTGHLAHMALRGVDVRPCCDANDVAFEETFESIVINIGAQAPDSAILAELGGSIDSHVAAIVTAAVAVTRHGRSVPELARQCGVSTRTVAYWLARHAVCFTPELLLTRVSLLRVV